MSGVPLTLKRLVCRLLGHRWMLNNIVVNGPRDWHVDWCKRCGRGRAVGVAR